MEKSSAFLVKMEDLVRQVVAYNNIPCYRVDSAIETHINASGEHVDIPVIRVVGFFEDTISKITNVLNSEFELYLVGSNNQNTFTSSTKIYQAALRQNRLELPEYIVHQPHKFDVHVSSILQDVYTAMHRNLANGTELPETLKRDFYRIGAFLEMADIEFIKIRNRINNSEAGTTVTSMPQLHVVERDLQAVNASAPAARQAEATSISAKPDAIEPANTTAKDHIEHIESMDMSVDSFDALAISIGNIDSRTGSSNNDYFNLLTSSSGQKQADSYDLLSSVKNIAATPVEHVVEEVKAEPVVAPPPAERVVEEPMVAESSPSVDTTKNGFASPSDGVSLNIDKIDTFNMNVSGMIEREIIREVNTGSNNAGMEMAAAAVTPSIEHTISEKQEEKNHGPVNMDEHAQMNDAMLREFVSTSAVVKEVDRMIADRAGAKINDEIDIEGDVERLRFLKVNTLSQLSEKISDNKDDIVAFAEKWIGKDNGGSFDSGICLFYLEYLLVGKKNDPAFSVEYVLKFISDNDYSARYIIPTYNAIRVAAGEPAANNFAHLTLK